VSDWRRTSHDGWLAQLAAVGIDPGLAERCAAYLELLARWDEALNLVGRVDTSSLLRAHLLESLAGVAHLPVDGRLLDLGSGNGFPAVPLLLAEPRLVGVLLEPRERRWGFLREVIRELGLRAEVVRARVEDIGDEEFAAITVRALAMRVWWPQVGRLSGPGTVLLHWSAREGGGTVPGSGWCRVVTSPLPDPRRGQLLVWRRCST
jgi:16S rRNA (guanine527-N7)-methyltransferase